MAAPLRIDRKAVASIADAASIRVGNNNFYITLLADGNDNQRWIMGISYWMVRRCEHDKIVRDCG